jgi:hypothetical protein
MPVNIKKWIPRLLGESSDPTEGSVAVHDQPILEAFINDPQNTFLISFSRTGSHWLRMLMELYFERPSLVRVFYYPERRDYLTLHTHDMDLEVVRPRVIYLYRDPVNTIYSQLNYYKENVNDRQRIFHWADLYGRHLDKWLHTENFTTQKTVLRYEGLVQNMPAEFAKLTEHFGQTLDLARLNAAAEKVSKSEVKKKTAHDSQVVNLNDRYETSREQFMKQQDEYVWQVVLANRPHLRSDFESV